MDLKFDLRSNTYEQQSPSNNNNDNNHLLYINKNSNYSTTIFRELPGSISERLYDLSSSTVIFEKATPMFSETLPESESSEHLVNKLKINASDNTNKI